MYLSSKNNHLFSKKYRFSCLSPTEHDLLDLIEVNFIKTQDVCSKIVAFYSIRLTIQVNIENMYFRWKIILILEETLIFVPLAYGTRYFGYDRL